MSNLLNINGGGQILLRRRALMMANANPYEELKYISTNRGQYINTGLIPLTRDWWVHAKLYTEETGNRYWFGADAVGGTRAFAMNALSPTQLETNYADNNWGVVSGLDVVGRVFTVDFAKEYKFWVDDVMKWNMSHLTNFRPCQLPFNIFQRAGGSASARIAGRCYEFIVYSDATTQVGNFVPRLRKSDGKPGMLDLVTNTFFVNQGTGEFGYEKLDGTIVNPI